MRVLVISDIHSNLTALDAVLEAAGPTDAIWQLGDVVGYGPDPNEVVARLRDAGAAGVRGNHDAAAVGRIGTDLFNGYAAMAIDWTRDALAGSSRTWLEGLDERLDERIEADGFGMRHGSFRDPVWEYILDPAAARASLRIVDAEGLTIGLHGHTHLPAIHVADRDRVRSSVPSHGSTQRLDDGPMLLNPGSVGQPRDGIPDASFMLLDTERREATWRRVAYDIEAVQGRIRRAGLPDRLAERLAYGM